MPLMQTVVLCLKLSCLGVQIVYKDFPKVVVLFLLMQVFCCRGSKLPPLKAKSLVYHNQDRIVSIHQWKVHNQIHRTISKWPCRFCSFSRNVCQFRWGSVDFELLAGATSWYIVLYKCSESLPPIVLLYCIVCPNFAWVSCCFMIMKAFHYFSL